MKQHGIPKAQNDRNGSRHVLVSCFICSKYIRFGGVEVKKGTLLFVAKVTKTYFDEGSIRLEEL
jgi:hypothetical protein